MTTTNYIWDPVSDTILKEEDPLAVTIAEYNYEPVQFGRLVSQQRNSEANYYHYDGLGSTSALTSDNGTITDTYHYDACGNHIAATGITENPFRYVGLMDYYFEPEFQHYHIRVRQYHPGVARWESVDPLSRRVPCHDATPCSKEDILPGVYVYADNNFMNRVDPSGKLAGCSGVVYVPQPRSTPRVNEACGWIPWSSGSCCTAAQVKAAKECCKAQDKVLKSCSWPSSGITCGVFVFECKKKKWRCTVPVVGDCPPECKSKK